MLRLGAAFLPNHVPTLVAPKTFSASRVPAMRARIFANAVSRLVELSSQNGEKPQSSVVPSCSTGMNCAASSTRSRTSSAVSIIGAIGEMTPTNARWSWLQILADELKSGDSVPLSRKSNVEARDVELKQAREELRIIDVRAMSRVAVASGASVHADAPAFGRRKSAQGQIVQVDEAREQRSRRVDLDRQSSLR